MNSPALVVTGASGLVGKALGAVETVVPLRRGEGPLSWDPTGGQVEDDGRALGAVVHLAGEPIAGSRWNEARKRSMSDSRVLGTRTLVGWLTERKQRPEVLVSASAIGLYGDRGDEVLDEDATPGTGFLAELVEGWEREARAAANAGIRVVILRIGIVISRQGGALEKMRLPFSLGLGGPVGSGQQWFPWVHLDDVVGVIRHALRTPSMRGPYNLVAPGVVRQRDFARALGKTLHRPAVLPAPRFALRAAFGEMADEALLSSARVVPRRLLEAGYRFQHPDLAPALESVLR